MKNYILALKERLAPRELPYVRALDDGSLSRDDFVETQIQFLFAVVFFSRPMAALAGRVPRPEQRVGLLENIADEHGGGHLRFSHESTFLTLLGRLGVTLPEVERRALWPEVRAFNTALAGLCLLDDVPTALAALGMIEDLFATISARLGRGIEARGFLPAAEIVHYATHERLDEEHAEAFYRPLSEPYAQHPRSRYQIEQGLELGGHLLVDLYANLWHNRARRWTRSVAGPHSLSDGWHLEASGT
jgi:pyrroloquinoline quinone (PQQ) biosynthesis protein C